jgi:ATP-dependent 26S proteasome regulatory subunit
MDELAGLTDADLQTKIRDMEAEMRRNRQQMTRITQEQRLFDARLNENTEKLKMSTQLPHLVANVGELLDVEVEEDEGQEGSGFAIKKTDD